MDDFLRVKEEAHEADAAWQAAQVLSDLAEALTDDRPKDASEGRGAEIAEAAAGVSEDGDVEGEEGDEKKPNMEKMEKMLKGSHQTQEAETDKSKACGEGDSDEDVAIRAAEALGSLASLMEALKGVTDSNGPFSKFNKNRIARFESIRIFEVEVSEGER